MHRLHCERGAALKGMLILILLVVLGVVGIAYTFGYVIYPGEIGVRKIAFGPGQGFKPNSLSPGYHWNIPIYSKIYSLPNTIQKLELSKNEVGVAEAKDSLEVQTTDGSSVNVDITILFRIYGAPGEGHGGPADLVQRVGFQDDWYEYLYNAVNNELKKSLGGLSTSEFYDPDARLKQLDKAQKSMNERLAPTGLQVVEVLLKRYTYAEARIDNAIFEKNLQEQEEKLNSASSKLAEAQAELEQISAEWDAKIKTLQVKGDNRVRVLASEAELYETKKKAEGDLEVDRAMAQVDRLRANALASTEGAAVYVAREIAPLVGSLKGGVISEIDPYNLDQWMKRLGFNAGEKSTLKPAASQRGQSFYGTPSGGAN